MQRNVRDVTGISCVYTEEMYKIEENAACNASLYDVHISLYIKYLRRKLNKRIKLREENILQNSKENKNVNKQTNQG